MKSTGARVVHISDPFAATTLDYTHNLIAGTTRTRNDWRYGSELVEQLVLPKMKNKAPGEADNLEAGVRRYVREHGRRMRTPTTPKAPAGANMVRLAELFGLSPIEVGVLTFAVALRYSSGLRRLVDNFEEVGFAFAADLTAAATALPPAQVRAALAPGARLRTCGLVNTERGPSDLEHKLHVPAELVDAVCSPRLSRASLLHRFLEVAPASTLELADYAPVRPTVELARALLGATGRNHTPGVNILLHGPSGTGKSELASLLGRLTGLTVYRVGRTDKTGDAPSPCDRLESLRLANQIVGANPAILLFDELEDLFTLDFQGPFSRSSARMSKAWFNDLLETNPCPTIWTTNRVDGIDPAFLRRFRYSIALDAPTQRQRERILARHLADASALEPADVAAVAARFPETSPAELASAVSTARLVAPDRPVERAALEPILAAQERLLLGRTVTRAQTFEPARYRLDVLRCDEDLERLVERLTRWRPGSGLGLTLLLSGPPGSGKSELIRYLAHRMGRPLVVRCGSDLLDMYVGGTEQRLAAAFREAEADDAVLLLDEVDTFLGSREGAHQKWEVSQTNELLQQLESFRGVVACTTNRLAALDAAALRRFSFKLELGYLQPAQAIALYRAVFADDAPEAELPCLTPGDFAVVARRLRALDETPAPDRVLALLREECAAKRAPAGRIGFSGVVRPEG